MWCRDIGIDCGRLRGRLIASQEEPDPVNLDNDSDGPTHRSDRLEARVPIPGREPITHPVLKRVLGLDIAALTLPCGNNRLLGIAIAAIVVRRGTVSIFDG